jgi:hypothetical protein
MPPLVQRGVNSMKCFVIGPIGEAGSEIRAAADDFMKYIVLPVVSKKGCEYDAPIRADSMNEPGRITSQIIKLLMDADLVIADLTGNNPNVYYELCLRHALGKPVIHMASDGTKLWHPIQNLLQTQISREKIVQYFQCLFGAFPVPTQPYQRSDRVLPNRHRMRIGL